jgi:hypothetical protein
MIVTVRKAGRISVIADYYGLTMGVNIGAFMEKGLAMRGVRSGSTGTGA